jgi:hypothetical protein
MPTEPTSAVGGTPRATRFSLAANYDPELVPALGSYPVDEVYGKFWCARLPLGRLPDCSVVTFWSFRVLIRRDDDDPDNVRNRMQRCRAGDAKRGR